MAAGDNDVARCTMHVASFSKEGCKRQSKCSTLFYHGRGKLLRQASRRTQVKGWPVTYMRRVGHNHTYRHIYSAYTASSAKESPYARPCTVCACVFSSWSTPCIHLRIPY
jgi:hypothetical protein